MKNDDDEEVCPECGSTDSTVFIDEFPCPPDKTVQGQGYRCNKCGEAWCTSEQIAVILARIYEVSGIKIPMPPEDLSYGGQRAKQKP